MVAMAVLREEERVSREATLVPFPFLAHLCSMSCTCHFDIYTAPVLTFQLVWCDCLAHSLPLASFSCILRKEMVIVPFTWPLIFWQGFAWFLIKGRKPWLIKLKNKNENIFFWIFKDIWIFFVILWGICQFFGFLWKIWIFLDFWKYFNFFWIFVD